MSAIREGLCFSVIFSTLLQTASLLPVYMPDRINQPYADTVVGQHALFSYMPNVGADSIFHTHTRHLLESTDILKTTSDPNDPLYVPKHEHKHHSKSLWDRLQHGVRAIAGHHYTPENADQAKTDSEASAQQATHAGVGNSSATDQGVPADFDWEAYVALHPDIQQAGIITEEAAHQHYIQYGRREGRMFRRPKLILHYTACGGLTNQIYSHIPAFVLGEALGAELVLPPALMRSSFGHHSHEIVWTPSDIALLLDADRIIAEWQARGMMVHKTPPTAMLPALATPDLAWPLNQSSDEEERLTVRLENMYERAWELQNLTQTIHSAVAEHVKQLRLQDSQAPVDHIDVYLPCTMFMLQTVSAEEKSRAAEAARTLHFAPALTQLADKVLAGMEANGLVPFNALHLRMERDAKEWTEYMGGLEMVKLIYGKAMHEAAFNATMPLYIGSGLLTYGAKEELLDAEQTFLGWGLGKLVQMKETYLTEEDLGGLASEQKAAVDFLVMARSRHFVGLGFSSLSSYMRQYRALQGLPYNTSVLIAGNPIFHQAGVLVDATA